MRSLRVVTDLPELLAQKLARAFADVAGSPADPAVRRSDRADYQADGALRLAKQLGRPPREVAAEVLERADLGELVAAAQIAGPGFVNLTVSDAALSALVEQMAADTERLGVATTPEPERVLVDYSGPNVAKEMHVGHLRSTIIGDALSRLLTHLGHDVVRQNHIGDWGTPFGMLIEHMLDLGAGETAHELSVGDLGVFYRGARQKFDADPDFADRARRRVVALQGGDAETLALWRLLVEESERYFAAVYDRLSVLLTPADIAGESSYNDQLGPVIDELIRLGLARESEGALCVFPDGFTGRDGGPLPLILRKSDGGFGYDTTDLAALRHRVHDLKARRLVYITDLGQRLHFEMIFQAGREAGWLGAEARAEFQGFGIVLGPDRKRLRTRSGDSVKLIDLIEEAVRRAAAVVAEKAPHLSAEEQADVARIVGIGALKYADLSNDRVKDYVFDWDRMLSFDGNTAPYLQYAHARIHSVFRRGEIDPASVAGAKVVLADPAEHALALRLAEFEGVLHKAVEEVELHRIAGYLFELATAFTAFYERCPVLRAEDDRTRTSRLVLCDVTARVLATGLSLLGIAAPTRM
ncbi:arginyl-tRNA synthetase [Actinopolymorpha cephalotaxi]|uniref:Arginine--tRNA ligase n=1 Tax=Actinopolymorpha cephalotaxi TaxID=504797 RepID=A0A1I2PIE6_9ACTN|nr:arginyl-tRNA synthetase [Actinopolymorpha cephalotaxi]